MIITDNHQLVFRDAILSWEFGQKTPATISAACQRIEKRGLVPTSINSLPDSRFVRGPCPGFSARCVDDGLVWSFQPQSKVSPMSGTAIACFILSFRV